MSHYLYDLIAAGEHQRQDFKFEISDARKISKTLSAFSNTDGGRLLVGVKDNGKIAGIRSEEEIYMIEAAAKLYCKPQIKTEMLLHQLEKRIVLEVIIKAGKQKPYYAKDHNNKNWAYLRIKDENILASPVHLKLWKQEKSPQGDFIHYSIQEQILLDYLSVNQYITINQYCKLAHLSRSKAEEILAKLIRFELIDFHFENHQFYFKNR